MGGHDREPGRKGGMPSDSAHELVESVRGRYHH